MTNLGKNPLSDFSDEELLWELINRHGKGKAPMKTVRYVPFWETIVPIGKDNVCSMILSDDDFIALSDQSSS